MKSVLTLWANLEAARDDVTLYDAAEMRYDLARRVLEI